MQHVDVERSELFEQRGEAFDVLFHPVGVRALQHHHEIGQGAGLDVLGNTEIETGGLGDATHHQDVDVLEDGRVDAALHNVWHRMSHLGQGGERGQDRGRRGGPGLELHGHLRGDGQGPLGADEQLREVVAARDLDELPAGPQDGAVGQHHLEPEHVVACHPVADGTHPAGVGGHVPSEGPALLAG
jgi:hypothetical protein